MSKSKIILDLYGGTGAWSKPYAEAGYDVRVITLPELDTMTYIPPHNVYGILAACPCEIIGNASAHLWAKRESDLIILHCAFVTRTLLIVNRTRPIFWVIENPPGKMKLLLGKPQYKIQPYEFGDDYTKLTYLWGNFIPPMKKYTDSKTKQTDYIEGINKNRKVARSITPVGFAQAFFEANR